MANVSMESLIIGQQYTAVQLAHIWGYESHHALVRGMVTPSGTDIIILFVTKTKQSGSTQYIDKIEGNVLFMMGQEKHGSDKRLFENLNIKKDRIYLFFRDMHHTPFEFLGRCYLINAVLKEDAPSEFEFLIESLDEELDNESDIMDYVINISTESGDSVQLLIEGAKKITQHVRYERNINNRDEAIRLQGHKCKICGFDFNEVYGEELAENYIEVHHIKQLADGEQTVDPAKDLLPVCANCHRMLHRKRKGNISVENMKNSNTVLKYAQLLQNGMRRGDK